MQIIDQLVSKFAPIPALMIFNFDLLNFGGTLGKGLLLINSLILVLIKLPWPVDDFYLRLDDLCYPMLSFYKMS